MVRLHGGVFGLGRVDVNRRIYGEKTTVEQAMVDGEWLWSSMAEGILAARVSG
jgi:hypothetical protein